MKKKLLSILFICLAVSIAVISFTIYDSVTGIMIIEKNYTQDVRGAFTATLTYNSQTYYYAQIVDTEDPKIIHNFWLDFFPYDLLSMRRIPLNDCVSSLPSLDNGAHYRKISKNYYIFENDSTEHPIVIFEKNTSAAGPSDGWYYFLEGYDFIFPILNKNEVEKFILLDSHFSRIIAEIDDKTQIRNVITFIEEKRDLIGFLRQYADESVYMYAVYKDTPWVQRIGAYENNEFVYARELENSFSLVQTKDNPVS